MAAVLNMYNGGMMTSKDDAVVYEPMLAGHGIVNSGTITWTGSNQVHFDLLDGVIKGRKFTIPEQLYNVQLPESDGVHGRLYLRMDLSDSQEPLQIKSVCQTELPALEQDEDCNYNNGVYEIELATYTANKTTLTEFKVTVFNIKASIKEIKQNLEKINNNLTNINTYVGEDGKLHFVDATGADSVLPFSPNGDLLWTNTSPIAVNNLTCPCNWSKYTHIRVCLLRSYSDTATLQEIIMQCPSSASDTSDLYKMVVAAYMTYYSNSVARRLIGFASGGIYFNTLDDSNNGGAYIIPKYIYGLNR